MNLKPTFADLFFVLIIFFSLAEVSAEVVNFDSSKAGLWENSTFTDGMKKPSVEQQCYAAAVSKEWFEHVIPAEPIRNQCQKQIISESKDAAEIKLICSDRPQKTTNLLKAKRIDSQSIETSVDSETAGVHTHTKFVRRYLGPCLYFESQAPPRSQDDRCAECVGHLEEQKVRSKTATGTELQLCLAEIERLKRICTFSCVKLH